MLISWNTSTHAVCDRLEVSRDAMNIHSLTVQWLTVTCADGTWILQSHVARDKLTEVDVTEVS